MKRLYKLQTPAKSSMLSQSPHTTGTFSLCKYNHLLEFLIVNANSGCIYSEKSFLSKEDDCMTSSGGILRIPIAAANSSEYVKQNISYALFPLN